MCLFLPSFRGLVPSGKVLVLWRMHSSMIRMQWFLSCRKSRVWFSCTSLSVGGSTVRVCDEAAVKVHKPKERLHVADILQFWPTLDHSYLHWVHVESCWG